MMGDDETTVAGRGQLSPTSKSKRPVLILLSGPRTGEALVVTQDNVLVGRDPDATLCVDVEGVSRRHAKIVLLPGNVCMVTDLKSTNGTFIEAERVDSRILEHGDCLSFGPHLRVRFAWEDKVETQMREHLFREATIDPLTKVNNRRAFGEELKRAIAFSRRHSEALSLVLFDVDFFKRVNDSFGHVFGDEVLIELARRVKKTIRTEDFFARIGGEEWALILRGIDLDGALHAAERVRIAISETPIGSTISETVTVSLGVATYSSTLHLRPEDLVEQADQRLYQAKEGGRNRVCPPVTGRGVPRVVGG